MSIVGFHFNKINVEKSDGTLSGNLNIQSNIRVRNIEGANLALGTAKHNAIKLSFEFSSVYGNNLANITLGGHVLFMAPSDTAKKAVEEWKKKKIDKTFLQPVLNHVYTRCNVAAVALSKDVSLPPPVPMPHFTLAAKSAAPAKKQPAPKKKAPAKKKAAKKK